MIFRKTLLREFAVSGLGVFLVLLAITVTTQLIRYLEQAARVYFVEHIADDEKMVANIFVSSTQHHQDGVMVARSGYQETQPNGDRFLVLLNGKRYEGPGGSAEYRVVDFQRYSMRIETF